MRIVSLNTFAFPVRFKHVFRHASAARSHAENLIVEAHSACGQVGYGEGCPRNYVTGESPESAIRFANDYGAALAASVFDIATLRNWASTHRDVIDRNPAAYCAVELAILDLMGKCFRLPIEGLTGTVCPDTRYRYSAVLGDASFSTYLAQTLRYWSGGFRDFKVKLSGELNRDRRKLHTLIALPARGIRIRLDANNLWHSPDECIAYLLDLPGCYFAVEEPLQKGDLDGMRRVAAECGTKIILDESLWQASQVSQLSAPTTWVVNIRVSKMGGVLRSLEAIGAALHRGVAVIVGAHVGETSILTRAALPVAAAADRSLLASEGAFGTHLLANDLADTSVMFGRRGHLDPITATNEYAPGLGLEINRSLLNAA